MGYGCYTMQGGGSNVTFVRRYTTKDERIAWLKEYQAELEQELQAVKERIEAVSAQ